MKILFCGMSFPEARERLATLLPDDEILAYPPDTLGDHIAEADVIVPLVARVDGKFIRRGTFGLIQQFGVGLETVDIGAATRSGVRVARIPSEESGNAASVAEHAILLMLMLSRRWNEIARRKQEETRVPWGSPAGQALLGKTVCIVGLGGVGRELARRLSGFRLRLITVDDHPGRTVPGVDIARACPLERLAEAVAEADYVMLCINYTPDRFHLVGARELGAMKKGVFVVNVARGGLLDPDALLAGLRTGQVGGAGLDVYWDEPVDFSHPLFRENVVATPHIAGVTDISYEGIARAFAGNMRRYAAGEPPLYLANAPSFLRRPDPNTQ
ncbi:MAG TPA: 2-hydroxyacid dehydrogenase [Methanoregula sp.]|nr:2-hydroxyacid dehydrogenase [Methanoregula sp.]